MKWEYMNIVLLWHTCLILKETYDVSSKLHTVTNLIEHLISHVDVPKNFNEENNEPPGTKYVYLLIKLASKFLVCHEWTQNELLSSERNT